MLDENVLVELDLIASCKYQAAKARWKIVRKLFYNIFVSFFHPPSRFFSFLFVLLLLLLSFPFPLLLLLFFFLLLLLS